MSFLPPAKTVSLPITISTKDKVEGSCSVVVQDETNPQIKDTEKCSVKAEGVALCTPNSKRCNGKLIEQCTSSGSGYEILKQCGETESCKLDVNSNPSCIAAGGKAPIITPCDPILKAGDVTILPNFSRQCVGTLSLILIIASAIGGILALIIMLGFTNPRIENKGLSFFLSAIVAIGIGALIYLLFWWGVLAFILLMILWFVIPKPFRKEIKKGIQSFKE